MVVPFFYRHAWLRTCAIAGCAVTHLALWRLGYSPFGSQESELNLWVTLFFTIALILPFWSLSRIFFLWVVCILILNFLNSLKLKYLHHQLSEHDFRAIISAPNYCFDAVFGYGMYRYLLPLLTALFLFLAIKYRGLPYAGNIRKISHKSLAISSALIIFFVHYSTYKSHLENYLTSDVTQQKKDELIAQLDVLGTIAYLGSEASFYNVKSVLRKDVGQKNVTKKSIEETAKKYLGKTSQGIKPNIVFVLVESTFDPNDIFILRSPYRDNALFSATKNEYYGKFGVPITGGRTWFTEFETIAGISTKALGARDYINDAATPHLRTSFAKYLGAKDYNTIAFFPTIAAFVSSGKTYSRDYGFEKIEDTNTMNFDRAKMRHGFDRKMMEKVLMRLPKKNDRPFFSYVVLLENHGPHDCRKESLNPDEIRLLNDDDFRKNCEIDEYLNRAKSTAAAIELLKSELEKIEKDQERPFLIAIFGDHQPWTFNEKDYNSNRIKDSSRYTTFYKIIPSASLPRLKVPKTIPANLLPSIVSSIFATKSEELFLPENFYLFEKCGVIENVGKCLSSLHLQHLDYGDYFSFSRIE